MDLLQAAMDYHLGTFGVVFIAITLLLFSFFHLYRHTVLCQKQCIHLFGDNWTSQTLYKVIALVMLSSAESPPTPLCGIWGCGVGLMTVLTVPFSISCRAGAGGNLRV